MKQYSQQRSRIIALGLHISPIAGASLITTLGGAIWWACAVRLSPPEQVGQFVVFSGIAMIVTELANLGMGYVVIRYHDEAGPLGSSLIRTSLALITGATFLAVAGLLSGVTLFAAHLAVLGQPRALLLSLLAALGQGWYTFSDNLLLALERRKLLPLRAVIVLIGRLGSLALLGAYSSWRWEALLLSYAAPLTLTALATFAVISRDLRAGCREQMFLQWKQLSVYLPYGVQSYLGNMMATITPNLLPALIASHRDTAMSAQFGVIWMLANLLLLVPGAISIASFSLAARNKAGATKVMQHSMQLVLIIQSGSILATLLMARLFLPYLGPTYAQIDTLVLTPFLLGVACTSFTAQTYAYARTVDRGLGVILAGQTAQTVLTLALAWLLLPQLGLAGVALAWLTGAAVTLALVRWAGQPYLHRLHSRSEVALTTITPK